MIPALKECHLFGADSSPCTFRDGCCSEIFVKWWWLIFSIIGEFLLLLPGLEAQREDAEIHGSFSAENAHFWRLDCDNLALPVDLALAATMFAAGESIGRSTRFCRRSWVTSVYSTATEKIQQEVSTGTSLSPSPVDNAKAFPW